MKLIASIAAIINKSKEDNVSAFAAEAALFICMSFVPFLMLLLLLIKYTPLTKEMLLEFVNGIAPDAFKSSLESIITNLYSNVSSGFIFITIISLLWTAGKGFVSLIDGLNSVFNIKEYRNDFVIRLYAILYTVVFAVIIVLCLALLVLGNQILSLVHRYVPLISHIIDFILQFRALFSIVLFTIFFTFLYVAIPHKHTKIKRQLPGAIFAALGWAGFSFFFSLYVNYSKNLSVLYGSLTTVVCAMIWLYVCMFIFLIGAEINLFVEQWTAESSIKKATDVNHSDKHS
ncbi:MAG: YihY/virulence factor BrkB family protein [Butyrivibrio sp.]